MIVSILDCPIHGRQGVIILDNSMRSSVAWKARLDGENRESYGVSSWGNRIQFECKECGRGLKFWAMANI